MIRSADVATFLAAHGVDAKIHFQGDVPDVPDGIVVLDLLPALPPSYELLFNRPVVRATVYGQQSDPAAAEALMSDVDSAFLDPVPPFQIGGKHVTSIQQFSGPGLVGLDDPSSRRPVLSATYVIEIARA